MLITRAPVRISFAGGGTDLAAYYLRYGGMVVSAAINKYFYTLVSPAGSDDGVQVISSDYQTFYRHDPKQPLFWNGTLQLPKAILHHFGVDREYNLFLASEVPPGTGLGSSGSVAVTLVRAVSTLCGLALSAEEVAETAAYIEIEKLGMPVGKQDQYTAAFGGVNAITFNENGVKVEPLRMTLSALHQLERNLMLFFTGCGQDSSDILQYQKQAIGETKGVVIESLHALKTIAGEMRECLEVGEMDEFGRLLHQSWQYKKNLSPSISNRSIDHYYQLACEHGALGGKITGAGGGGFLMLYCPVGRQEAVTSAMEAAGLVRMNFAFDFQGVSDVLNTMPTAHSWAGHQAVWLVAH